MRKTAIITGANAGLGFQVARQLLSDGVDLLMGSRCLERGQVARQRLQLEFPDAQIQLSQLDLSDFESIGSFAEQAGSSWDYLVNNAGAKIESPYKQTHNGHEWHLGVNHLGHFALTRSLWPKASASATVVSVSSIVARRGKLDLNPSNKINAGTAYANSKLMNYAFAIILAKKIELTDRKSVAAHPGFARANTYGNSFVRFGEYVLAQSAEAGARPISAACHSENGSYLAPKYFELWGKPKLAKRPEINQLDLDDFWSRSEELTGEIFNPTGN
jgi:NAD(P)-dependent dehydrogenase (short-subunit alcohol dehydrogenase family)